MHYDYTAADTALGRIYNANATHTYLTTGDPLIAVLDRFTVEAQSAVAQYRDEAIPAVIERHAVPVLAGIGGAIDAGRRVRQTLAERDLNVLTPAEATQNKATFYGSEIRGTMLRATPAERAMKVRTATTVEAAALLALPEAAGLTDDDIAALRQRARMIFYAERIGLSAKHAVKPSVDSLTAVGVDQSAVEAEAAELIAALDTDHAAADDREAVLQSLVAYAAAALGITPAQALERALDA